MVNAVTLKTGIRFKMHMKSHGQDLVNQPQVTSLGVQSNFVTKNTVCISSLVTHGQQGGDKEPAMKPSG
jgi:hypothetical protein